MPQNIHPSLSSLVVNVSKLHLDPANARTHGPKNIEAIKESLSRFGQRKPIVVQRDGMVVRAGNGTLHAAKALGWKKIAAVIVDEENSSAEQFAVADNRTAELAEWDAQALAALMEGWDEETRTALGFDQADIDALASAFQSSDEIVEVEAPPLPDVATTRTGDLWLLGDHRLLCGDSTKAEDVARLMAGAKADLCFTSPPYGQQRDYTKEGKEKCQDWDGLMRGVFGNLPMADAGQVLVNLGLIHRDGEWIPYWHSWVEWMREQGWRRFGWYVWDQGPGMPGDWNGRLAPSHEFIWHFNRQSVRADKARECKHAGESHGGKGQRGADGYVKQRSAGKAPVQSHAIHDSVFRVNRQGAMHGAGGHPAPYPVGLPVIAMQSWPGSCYEPFLGSGTTLIAAEQLGRKCYGMEISPQYCDVIVERWQKLTGRDATLDGDGRTFAALRKERANG